MLPPTTNVVISTEYIPLYKDIEKEVGFLIMDGFFRGKIIPGYTHECSWIVHGKKMACISDDHIALNLPEPTVIIDQIVQHTVDPAKFLEGKPGSLCLECDVWIGGEAKLATFHVEYRIFTSGDGKRFVQRKVDTWVNNSGQDDILEAHVLPLFAVENAAIERHLQGE
jgi:hypothetical protein